MSNLQLELLKLFSLNVNDEELLEIKKILSDYFTGKSHGKINVEENNKVNGYKPVFGSAKGIVSISGDFNEHLDDFNDYEK